MPFSEPRGVDSNQETIHLDLLKVVQRHLNSSYRRPISAHTQVAFEDACAFVAQRGCSVVLDSGCGTGESTWHLAQRFPHCTVLGIDKSPVRLGKAGLRDIPPNVRYIRADLQDFWPLVHGAGWDVVYHALYYPNPWPKSAHFMRRFHGHPVFPILLKLSPQLELRTNWLIYAQEFLLAAELAGCSTDLSLLPSAPAITAFERKYASVYQPLWQVKITCDLNHVRS